MKNNVKKINIIRILGITFTTFLLNIIVLPLAYISAKFLDSPFIEGYPNCTLRRDGYPIDSLELCSNYLNMSYIIFIFLGLVLINIIRSRIIKVFPKLSIILENDIKGIIFTIILFILMVDLLFAPNILYFLFTLIFFILLIVIVKYRSR